MKYSIEGFSQPVAVELELSSDDLIVLRWFVDFYGTNKMAKLVTNGNQYVWINYKSLLEDLPILKISKQTLSKRIFGNLVKAHVLKKEIVKNPVGTFTAFSFDYNYELLISNNPQVKNQTHTSKFTNEDGQNLPTGLVKNYQPKDNNTNNPNTKKSIKKKKTTGLDILIDSYTDNTELKETLRDFIKMRKSIKKPMTDKAMNLLTGKLDKLGSTDTEKIELLNQSILNSWCSVFPLKKENKEKEEEYSGRKIWDPNTLNI